MLLSYYISPRPSIIFCLFIGDIYLSISISSLFVSQLYCSEVFETFRPPLFEAVLNTSAADCLARSLSFWLYLQLKFLFIFLQIFIPRF